MLLLSEEIPFAWIVRIFKSSYVWRFFCYIITCCFNFALKTDPRLTARHGGGHLPMRIVMSQTLNLPDVAHLWDVADVPTVVATQRGARKSFQKFLASKGVEVVEFDILNPKDVMEYLYDRGYLSIFWECGGTLAASAISSGVIHKVGARFSLSFQFSFSAFCRALRYLWADNIIGGLASMILSFNIFCDSLVS